MVWFMFCVSLIEQYKGSRFFITYKIAMAMFLQFFYNFFFVVLYDLNCQAGISKVLPNKYPCLYWRKIALIEAICA